MKKVWKITSNVITVLLFVLIIMVAIVVISSRAAGGEPQIMGYQLKSVLSGSMEPTFQTGSIIAVKPVEDAASTVKENDVITYVQEDGSLVTHRVIDVINNGEQTMFHTKGDNNEDADTQPVLADNVQAVYTGYTIPYVGYFIDFAQSSKGTAILLIVPGILLLGYSGLTIYQAIREIDKRTKTQDSEKTA